jgi:hypothetical protein
MEMELDNRSYLIIGVNEINKVNFSQVLETSVDTLRYNVNNTKTFIKWEGDTPVFVNEIITKEGPYNHTEIMSILSTSEWVPVQPIH